ncbi:AsmA family protein [Vibrio sp. TRT 17S01]|uniref:AsmA family protein n=1 Tax=Vibrio sp. TRT 17S01 TaxID=3418505 RepID=UPI003CFA6A57
MRKLLQLLILLFALLCITILVLFGVMHSPYATQAVNQALSFSGYSNVSAAKATYQFPQQVTLDNVTIKQSSASITLPRVTIWVSQRPLQQNKLSLDSVLIEGATLSEQQLRLKAPNSILIHQLAFERLNVETKSWSVTNAKLQINKPVWLTRSQLLPYGDIQFSATQLYLYGEALNQILIDADYQASDSTVYGASFLWQGAKVSGQGEQLGTDWSLINVTINQLDLTQPIEQLSIWRKLRQYAPTVTHVNSLDVLRGNLSTQALRAENMDLSLENIDLTKPLWQQNQGYLSFNADALSYHEMQLIEASGKLALTPNQIEIEEFNSDFNQGSIQLAGKLKPNAVLLDQFVATGIKWLDNTEKDLHQLGRAIQPLEQLSITKLDINNSQWINLEQQPHWQLSGVNAEGTDLTMIQNGRLGLWHGQFELTANSASIDNLISSQAVITMNADDGKWALERFFVPLQEGYIDATGQWDRSKTSAPWQLTLHADGLPLLPKLIKDTDLQLNGMSELELDVKGLAGDYSMFAHSVSGSARLSLRDSQWQYQTYPAEKFAVDAVALMLDRGRFELKQPNYRDESVRFNVDGDFAQPEQIQAEIKARGRCQKLTTNLLTGETDYVPLCQSKRPPTHIVTPEATKHSDAAQMKEAPIIKALPIKPSPKAATHPPAASKDEVHSEADSPSTS